MANYYTERYNRFITDTSNIYEYLSGNYMNQYDGALLDYGELTNIIEGMHFYRINGYRKLENNQLTVETIKLAMQQNLNGCHHNNSGIGYFLLSTGNSLKVFLASEDGGLARTLNGVIPNISLENIGCSKDELRIASRYGGVITGIYNIDNCFIDSIARQLQGMKSVVGLIAKPLNERYCAEYNQEIMRMLDFAASLDSINNTFGNNSKWSVKRSFPENEILKTYLSEQKKRLYENNSSLWEMCIWFGGEDVNQSEILGNRILGTLSPFGVKNIECGHCFFTEEIPFYNNILALASAEYGYVSSEIPYTLRKSALTSFVTGSELASMIQLPLESYEGFRVHDVNITANSVYSFSTITPVVNGESFVIGKEAENGAEYRISFDSLTSHMLVTGATGGGKSNTNMNILLAAYRQGVPFCVIEPAKRDYWKLISDVKNLKVYTPGDDALPLRFNPLEPEEGVFISSHIDDLMYAFSGAFEMDTPTMLTIEGLLQYSYEKAGWNLGDIAYKQARRFPTLKDVLDNMDEYSRKEIRSGDEVRQNIEGAVIRRLKSLVTGTMGRITSMGGYSVTGRELCNSNVVIELDALSVDAKAFVSSLLLLKLSQYIRQQDSSHKLKNIILLEEAHNVFSAESTAGTSQNKDIASKYFSNLLSEIREYGTGIIIADQGASKINSNAIANTKTKIMHASDNEVDVDREAFAFRLNDFQKGLIPLLRTGEALIAVSGKTEVCKVKINLSTRSITNYACLFCPNRQFCDIEEVKRCLSSDVRKEIMISKIFNNSYAGDIIRNIANSYFMNVGLGEDMHLCALGYLLANSDRSEIECRRIIYRYVY